MQYIAYYRVSTDKQGASGLGLDAQRSAVKAYAADITHSFTEIESGKNDHRPQLAKQLLPCAGSQASPAHCQDRPTLTPGCLPAQPCVTLVCRSLQPICPTGTTGVWCACRGCPA
jgi:hypothetical protein